MGSEDKDPGHVGGQDQRPQQDNTSRPNKTSHPRTRPAAPTALDAEGMNVSVWGVGAKEGVAA